MFPEPTDVTLTMKPDGVPEKIDVEQHDEDNEIRQPVTAASEKSKSENHDVESLHDDIEHVVTLGKSIGSIENRSVRRAQSRASSTPSRPLSIVPRSKRRGILGRLTVVPEVDNPYDYKPSTKWGLTFIIALATAAAPLGSTIFYRKYTIMETVQCFWVLTVNSCSFCHIKGLRCP